MVKDWEKQYCSDHWQTKDSNRAVDSERVQTVKRQLIRQIAFNPNQFALYSYRYEYRAKCVVDDGKGGFRRPSREVSTRLGGFQKNLWPTSLLILRCHGPLPFPLPLDLYTYWHFKIGTMCYSLRCKQMHLFLTQSGSTVLFLSVISLGPNNELEHLCAVVGEVLT